jgi:hypothetical protein
MITKSVTIYDRGEDGLYLLAYARTDMGVLLAVPPFIHLTRLEAQERLWPEILGLMERSSGTVPHPKTWDDSVLYPLYEMAGCKNWNGFVRNARCCGVDVIDAQFVVRPMFRDGEGFSGKKAAHISLGANPSAREGTEAVMSALHYEW